MRNTGARALRIVILAATIVALLLVWSQTLIEATALAHNYVVDDIAKEYANWAVCQPPDPLWYRDDSLLWFRTKGGCVALIPAEQTLRLREYTREDATRRIEDTLPATLILLVAGASLLYDLPLIGRRRATPR